MTALAEDRNTPTRNGQQYRGTVKAGNTVFAGSILANETTNGVVPAADTSGLVVVGVAQEQAQAGENVDYRKGVFQLANNGNITAEHVGTNATVVDDQTVGLAADTTNDIVAGKIQAVDDDGVWIEFA